MESLAGNKKLQAFLIMALLAALAVPVNGAAVADYYREGDTWLYEVSDVIGFITYSGFWNVSYAGIEAKSIGGNEQDLHLFMSIWDLEVTGTFENATVTGHETLVDRQYATLDEYDTVMTETNQSVHWYLEYPPDTLVEMEGWTYNVSVYSPPGGTGDDPTYISVGDEWVNTYPIDYTTTEFDGFSTVQYSGSYEETVAYSVTGVQTVTVPAGTFSCTVVREEYANGGATRWISNRAGSDVKIVAYYDDGEEFVAELADYSFGARADRPGSTEALAASIVVALGTSVVVTLLFLRKRGAEPQNPEGGYDPSKPPVSPPGQIL